MAKLNNELFPYLCGYFVEGTSLFEEQLCYICAECLFKRTLCWKLIPPPNNFVYILGVFTPKEVNSYQDPKCGVFTCNNHFKYIVKLTPMSPIQFIKLCLS